MATSTTNLGLIKPAGTDKIRIAQINQNSDTLDAAVGAVGSTSLQTQMNNVQDAIAIVANGDTHPAITAGQFVYVKNNTHSVAEGLHVATANISANGQITTSNVSADASGGLNALNAKIQDIRTLTSESATKEHANISAVETSIIRQKGDVVEVYLSFTVGTAITGNTDNLFSGLPEAVSYTRYALLSTDATSTKRARVAVDGTKIVNAYTNGGIQPGVYEGTIVYIAK